MSVDVTIQYVEGCPHWKPTYSAVAGILEETGVSAVLRTQRVDSLEDAMEYEFRGSPTVLIDGEDPFLDPQAPVALGCRFYSTPEGSSGVPPTGPIRQALVSE